MIGVRQGFDDLDGPENAAYGLSQYYEDELLGKIRLTAAPRAL